MSPRNEASEPADNIGSQAHCGQGDSLETAAATGPLLLCPVGRTGGGGWLLQLGQVPTEASVW